MSSPSGLDEDALKNASREEIMTALFARMVVQQTNMAMIFLGKEANPDTGTMTVDLEAAKFFIDQLEMIDDKTRGNLTPQEKHLLGQSLTALRMSFVEAMDKKPATAATAAPAEHDPKPEPSEPEKADANPIKTTDSPEPPQDPEPESRKKFTKKY